MNEEKSYDEIMHEKRVAARDAVREFSKKRSKAVLCTVFFVLALCVAVMPQIKHFYNNENVIGIIATVIISAILSVVAYYINGRLFTGRHFHRNSRLVNKWKSASVYMNKMEEKAAMREAFPDDVTKAEEKIIALSEQVNELLP